MLSILSEILIGRPLFVIWTHALPIINCMNEFRIPYLGMVYLSSIERLPFLCMLSFSYSHSGWFSILFIAIWITNRCLSNDLVEPIIPTLYLQTLCFMHVAFPIYVQHPFCRPGYVHWIEVRFWLFVCKLSVWMFALHYDYWPNLHQCILAQDFMFAIQEKIHWHKSFDLHLVHVHYRCVPGLIIWYHDVLLCSKHDAQSFHWRWLSGELQWWCEWP